MWGTTDAVPGLQCGPWPHDSPKIPPDFVVKLNDKGPRN